MSIKDSDIYRFHSKILIEKDPSYCWLFNSHKDKDGYSSFSVMGKKVRTHRFSVAVFSESEVSPHLVVMHSCDNPERVNHLHLSVGTVLENNTDMVRKGRYVRPNINKIFYKHGHSFSGYNVGKIITKGRVRRYCISCKLDSAMSYYQSNKKTLLEKRRARYLNTGK
jgi:hypothetical protein